MQSSNSIGSTASSLQNACLQNCVIVEGIPFLEISILKLQYGANSPKMTLNT